jgi:hypothetical protein
MTSNEDWRARFEREAAEQADHYVRIDRMWTESDLPSSIWKTPDWESGYDLLLDWFERRSKGLDWPSGETPRERTMVGRHDRRQERESSDHHMTQHGATKFTSFRTCFTARAATASAKEEGVRLILQWWSERLGK